MPPIPPTDLPACRFRLDTNTSDTLTLSDGRKIGYAQYGSPTGRAVFYLHGLPGCRLEAAYFDDQSKQLGIRLISVDRPGIGLSSPHPERKILDHPKEVESLAEHLKIDEFNVLGISGGGPSALACAMSMPSDKLKSVTVVCGIGPPDIGMKGANWLHWIGFTYGWRYFSRLTAWYLKRDAYLDLPDSERLSRVKKSALKAKLFSGEKDFEIMQDEDILRLSLRVQKEAFAQGHEGQALDGKLSCCDWGFRIEDIRSDLPVQLWYGKLDTFVPLNHGEQIAVRLDGRADLRVVDETHASISLYPESAKAFLEELVRNR